MASNEGARRRIRLLRGRGLRCQGGVSFDDEWDQDVDFVVVVHRLEKSGESVLWPDVVVAEDPDPFVVVS
jgi:hypothetical protein